MKKFLILFIIIAFTSEIVNAQWNVHWRKMRNEVIFGVGATNFLGDLGGAPGVGTHGVRDFNYESTRWLFNIGYRYKLAEEWAIRGSFFYGRLYGSDEFTENIHRNSRNLHFRSPIAEVMLDFQYSILRERYGHRYDLRRVTGQRNMPNLYIFTGVSGIYFNPQAQDEDGNWIDLQPLGTEGQGRVPSRQKYSLYSFAIPVGMGFNYIIDRNMGIGLEFGVRYAFTDYIDDVSTSYVHPDLFENDELAKYFHDRSEDWAGSGVYNQRGGNHRNDAYMFFTVNLTYKITPRMPSLPKF